MLSDEHRISEFKKALRQYTGDGVVDLDKNYPYKFDVQVHRLEDIIRNSRLFAPPNRWSFHRIGFIKEGGCEYTTGIFKFKASKNTLIVIPSRVITSSKDWAPDTTGYILLFNLDFFIQNNFSHQIISNKKILSPSVQPHVYVDEAYSEEIIRIFESIVFEIKEKKSSNKERLAVKILELLVLGEELFEQEHSQSADLPSEDIIMRFIGLLEENFSKEHSVKFYADQLSMHPNHLNALINKHTGLTAKETIQNKLILETKYLLHSTGLPVKEISTQMGFSDPNYFATFFKRFENLSPIKYRSSLV